MSIALNPELEHRIAVKVQSGRYQSPSEVIQESLELLEARDASAQKNSEPQSPPIWETVAHLGEEISVEEWIKIPPDLARNLDRHLYGSTKTSE